MVRRQPLLHRARGQQVDRVLHEEREPPVALRDERERLAELALLLGAAARRARARGALLDLLGPAVVLERAARLLAVPRGERARAVAHAEAEAALKDRAVGVLPPALAVLAAERELAGVHLIERERERGGRRRREKGGGSGGALSFVPPSANLSLAPPRFGARTVLPSADVLVPKPWRLPRTYEPT